MLSSIDYCLVIAPNFSPSYQKEFFQQSLSFLFSPLVFFLKTSTILVGPQSDKELLLLLQSESETYSEKVCIRGKTTGGIPFKGCDAVRTVGNGP